MPTNKELAKLVIKLEADSSTLRRDLRRVEDRVSRSSKRMQSSFAKAQVATAGLRTAVSKVHVGVAALAGASGLGLLVKRSLDYADAIDKAASKLGVTTDFLQESRFAAEQSGVAINTLEMAMQRFTRRAGEAANGTGEARDAIAELDLSLRDANGNMRSTEALFRDAMDALAGVDEPAERLRLAFKLFDSEGAVLVNMADDFKRLAAEAEGAGQVLGADTIRRAVDAKDELSKLSGAVRVLATEALVDLAGPMLDTAQGLADIAHFAGQAWAGLRDIINADPKNIEETKDRLAEAANELEQFIRLQNAAIEGRRNIFTGELPDGPIETQFDALIEERIQEIDRLEKRLEEFQQRTRAPAIPSAPDIDGRGEESRTKAEQSLIDKREKGLATLRRQAEEEQRLFTAQREGAEAVARVTAAIAAENQIRELGIDAKSREAQEIRDLTARQEELRLITENLEDANKTLFEQMTGNAETWRRSMGHAFADTLLTGQNAFKALGDSFVRDFLSRLSQQVIFEPLFTAFGFGKRADGGPVRAGQPYLVGERGPEIVVPNSNSFVIPNHRVAAASSGGSPIGGAARLTVNIYSSGADVDVAEGTGPNGERTLEIMVEGVMRRAIGRGAVDGPLRSRFALRPKGTAGA